MEPSILLAALALVTVVFSSSIALSKSRLDQFPGPAIARWTILYKAYYDIVKRGGWAEQLERLHRHYGPVVRVGPRELHFSDPDAYSSIYPVGSRFAKDYHTYKPMAELNHIFALLDSQEAMIRRGMMLPYMSKRSVLEREWIFQAKVNDMIQDLVNCKGTISVDPDYFRPFMGATIPRFCFPDIERSLSDSTLLAAATAIPGDKIPGPKFPWMWMKYIPLVFLGPVRRLFDNQNIATRDYSRINELKAFEYLAEEAIASGHETDEGNIFTTLLTRSAGSDHRPTDTNPWLMSEVLDVKYAGIDTTSTAMFFAIRYVLANDGIHRRLVEEVDTVWPDIDAPPGLIVLEKLPFLTAVIKESLRISIGVLSPMNRVVGPGDATISGHLIPEGTVVGMAHSFVLLNPEIFPDPHTFKPERWLQEDSHKIEKYLIVFGKGPRNCIGLNIAWCILYLSLTNIFRRVILHPVSEGDLSAPYRLSDDLVAVYEGPSLILRVTARQG